MKKRYRVLVSDHRHLFSLLVVTCKLVENETTDLYILKAYLYWRSSRVSYLHSFVIFVGSEKSRFVLIVMQCQISDLTTKSVQGSSLSFQGIDNVHGGDSLPLGVLGVGDSITDDILKENF